MAIPNEEKGQFKPGESGNIKGRPKGKSVSTILVELLAKATPREVKNLRAVKEFIGEEAELSNGEALAALLLAKALVKGDLAAVKEILDRTEGKALQKTDITTNGQKLILSEQEIDQRINEYLSKIRTP